MKSTTLSLLFLAACSSPSLPNPDSGSADMGVRDVQGTPDVGHDAFDMQVQYAPRILFLNENGQPVTQLRYGEAFAVSVVDAPPGVSLTLHSVLAGYEAEATFVTNAMGVLNTALDAPIVGSYNTISPEGLLWSMSRVRNERPTSLDIRVSTEYDGRRIEAVLQRAWLNEGLRVTPFARPNIVGELYQPEDALGPLPALMVLGGSEGGYQGAAFQAAMLAGDGYVVLALAYFDAPGLPAELEQIPLEYFEDVLEELRAREDVDGTRVGIIGTSRGGELALMLGARHSAVSAVVAQVPSAVRWGSVSEGEHAAWTEEGVDLAYLRSHEPPVRETLEGGGVGYRFEPSFSAALDTATPAELAAATISAEETLGAVLLLGGADDGIWPSCRFGEITMERLVASGHADRYPDAQHCYANSGHFSPTPGWPTTESRTTGFGSIELVSGGTPEGTAQAQRSGFRAVRQFLRAQLTTDE